MNLSESFLFFTFFKVVVSHDSFLFIELSFNYHLSSIFNYYTEFYMFLKFYNLVSKCSENVCHIKISACVLQ